VLVLPLDAEAAIPAFGETVGLAFAHRCEESMTCIVGIIDKDRIHMGADSAALGGYDLSLRSDEKIFVAGRFIMGFTSSFRMGQLLRYAPPFTPRPTAMGVFPYMVCVVVEEIRKVFKDGGWATREKEQESGGTFLVGYAGRLFRIDSDYQVAENLDGYDACGCAEMAARGSLFSTGRMKPIHRLKLALQAAEHNSGGVRKPFNFLTGGRKCAE
jgi:hypothetical protein